MAVTYPCYWQKKDQSGYWYWIYYAKNGEEIARSSESYVKRSDCYHSITGARSALLDDDRRPLLVLTIEGTTRLPLLIPREGIEPLRNALAELLELSKPTSQAH